MDFSGRGAPLTAQGLDAAAAVMGVAPQALWTVVTVETGGCGFLPDRRPVILFERHEFRRRTAGRFDQSHPEVSGPPGGYGAAGAHQYDRLAEAISLQRDAALASTSWGLGQIMGYNAVVAGFVDTEDMVRRVQIDEDVQLLAMAKFILGQKLNAALARNDWAGFALGYNGPGFQKNRYDTKLAASRKALDTQGLPDFSVRAAQLMLTYEGLYHATIDGRPGPKTSAAVTAFRLAQGLTAGAVIDEGLLGGLRARLPPDALQGG